MMTVTSKRVLGSVIQISGKNLGDLALEDCCERCFYFKLRVPKMPFSIFPGIFSSIDAWTKKLVRNYFETHGGPPAWLRELGQIRPTIRVPGHTEFRTFIPRHRVLLTGAPDELFLIKGKLIVVDFKTARHTHGADRLLPMYEVQLNAYARIAQECGFSPVTALYLIYMEPQTDGENIYEGCCTEEGMIMKFSAKLVKIDLNLRILDPLLARTREIYDLDSPPPGRPGCKDCALFDQLMAEAGGRAYGR